MIKHIKHRKFLIELGIFSALTAGLHLLALNFFLYWTTDWYDILMHFLGSATMTFLVLFVLFTSGYIKSFSKLKDDFFIVIIITLFSVLVIGLVWELWEIFVGFTTVLKDKGDTVLDVIMDMIGTASVLIYSKNKM